ncbi:MAG: shikimate kinase [Hominenteromicrobium sp.]
MKAEKTDGNIVLSGFMGCGKTTVGRQLASALGMKFVDMDLYIEKKTGKTVKEIFAEYGEAYFRALEAETVRELSESREYVIATGGGTLMQPQNVEAFHAGGGTIYYLDVPLAALQERLKNDRRRPLLQTPDRRAVIERLLNERRPQYLASADVVVDAGAPAVVVVQRLCALRGAEMPARRKGRRRKKHGTAPGEKEKA